MAESALDILKKAKQQFSAPPMAPMNWTKPATVRVGAFDLTESEIDSMILAFETTAPKEVRSGKNRGLELTFLTDIVNKVLGRGTDNSVASDYAAAKNRLDYLEKIPSQIQNGKITYLVNLPEQKAVFYSQDAFTKLVNNAKNQVKDLAPQGNIGLTGFGPQAKTYPNTPAGKLDQQKDIVLNKLAGQNERLNNPITSKLNKKDIVAEINKLNLELTQIDYAIKQNNSKTTATTVPVTGTTSPTSTTTTTVPASTATTVPATATTTATGTGVSPVLGVRVYTPEEVAEMLKPITKSGGGVKPAKAAAAKTVVVDTSWEPLFQQNYPQYKWMFTDLDRTKYGDVFDLFFKSIDPKTGKQVIEDKEFDRRFQGTSWYTELARSKKGRDVVNAVGSFSWGSGNLGQFLTQAGQFGWEGDYLKSRAYLSLFSKTGDKYNNPNAVTEVQASSPYLRLKKIGTDYLFGVNDDRVVEVLTGGLDVNGNIKSGAIATEDDLLRIARANAIAKYPHLKDSINAGVTMADLTYDYKTIAARTLELNPAQIDFAGQFNEAINYTKDGASRLMSTSEWETMLRTDPKYKYSFTKQANQDATSIGLAIARAFGKVG